MLKKEPTESFGHCGSLYSTPLLFAFGELFFFLSMLFSWDGVPVKKGFQSSSANWLSSPFFFFKKEINKIYFKRALKNYN